jgi:hypothetical protein
MEALGIPSWIFSAAQLVIILGGAWIGLLLRGIAKDNSRLEKAMEDAIRDRNERIKVVAGRLDSAEIAWVSVGERLHACQLDHLQRAQRAELRSTDLTRIEQSLTELFTVTREIQQTQATTMAQLAEVMRFFHRHVNGSAEG